jgi:hypothetical protein
MTPGFIYKISSPDNTLHYYGLTTQSVQTRFDSHIQSYNTYKNNNNNDYCASYIIFDKYPLQHIQIQTIESYHDISIKELRKKEKYYIQNFDCVNISGKSYSSDYNYMYFKDQHSHKYTHIRTSYILHNFDNTLIHILQTIGYQINHNHDQTITITHNTFKNLYYIHKTLTQSLQHLYINTNTPTHKNTIHILQSILSQYNLILLHKNIIYTYKHNNTYNNVIHFLIKPTQQPTTNTQLTTHQQNLDILYNSYLNNISNKKLSSTINLDTNTITINSPQSHTINLDTNTITINPPQHN